MCVFRDFGSICFDQTIIQCDSQGFSFPKGFSRLLFPVVTQHTQHFSLTAVFDKEVLSSSPISCPPSISCGLFLSSTERVDWAKPGNFMKKMSVVFVCAKLNFRLLGCF